MQVTVLHLRQLPAQQAIELIAQTAPLMDTPHCAIPCLSVCLSVCHSLCNKFHLVLEAGELLSEPPVQCPLCKQLIV